VGHRRRRAASLSAPPAPRFQGAVGRGKERIPWRVKQKWKNLDRVIVSLCLSAGAVVVTRAHPVLTAGVCGSAAPLAVIGQGGGDVAWDRPPLSRNGHFAVSSVPESRTVDGGVLAVGEELASCLGDGWWRVTGAGTGSFQRCGLHTVGQTP
jgi:hypothetical protein